MNKLILAVLIAAFLLVIPVQATIYVGGEDGVTSISEAIEKASENETIIVYEEVYRENVVIDKPLILKASGNVTIEAADSDKDVVQITANKVAFSWFNVKGGYVGIRLDNVRNCRIENNTAFENDYGIGLVSSSDNSIVNNAAFNNKVNGFTLEDCSNNNRIENNTALNNYGGSGCGGIRVFSSNNNTLTNNTLSSNTHNGIYLISSTSNILVNNFALNNSFGIWLENSSQNNIKNNTASENRYGIVLDSCSLNSIVT